MANLFSHKLLHDTVKNIIIPQMEDKIAVLQSWVGAINNKSIYKKTESECEQAFNLDIFHKVLGYTFYPTQDYTLEAKGGNEISGQKADATLGYFNVSDIEKNVTLVQVAVEIKDANTPLSKSQRREGNLSPIQQGFKYKPQYNNCKWVLVTNFVEIRLFKDTQLDYEVRQLTDLVDPKDDYQNFKVFWYLLNAKHLIAPAGIESITERLLSAVRTQSEQITKKFYQEYKALRLELINDIRKHNEHIGLDIVIQKAQKVIDRIVFVHFCEDFGLLPDGKLAEVIQHSQSLVGVSVRQILSGFFEAVNSGSAKLGIPNGYNGGLFHEDKELNNLKIGDGICQKFVDLSKYDFQEELSVNILGHIFEQSISDLENLRIEMLGTELETGELGESTKSNKRKKDGIFYTPEYIVDYIVRNSLGTYLEEQFETIEKKHLKNAKQMSDATYQEKQKSIYREYQAILFAIKVLDPACGSGAFLVRVFDYLLEENVRVMNVLSEGQSGLLDLYELAKDILTNNIYGVDLNTESVEITKLSLWLKTARKGKKLADLDNNIKCGNSLIDDPAVVGDKAFDRNKEFADIMNKGGFDVIVGNPPYGAKDASLMEDSYILFYYKAIALLKRTGFLGFITPDTRLINKNGQKLRTIILKGLQIIEVYDVYKVFADAPDVRCHCVILKNDQPTAHNKYKVVRNFPYDLDIFQFERQQATLPSESERDIYINPEIKVIFDRMSNMKLIQMNRNRGISPTPNDQNIITQKTQFTLVGGEDVGRYIFNYHEKYLIENYAKSLHTILELQSFEKIVIQRIRTNSTNFKSRWLISCLIKKEYIPIDSLGYLTAKNTNVDLYFILGILNSHLLNFYYKLNYTDKNVKPFYLNKLPIIYGNLEQQNNIAAAVKKIMNTISLFQEKIDFTLRFLQSKFGIEKLSTKLQKFRTLDFAGFLKELKIQKLPLDTQAELMRYFEKEQAEILALKSQIDMIDKQIDDMVFDLYGLTQEERNIVLDG